MTTRISYGLWQEGWDASRSVPAQVADCVEGVCEIGAWANPLLPPRGGYLLLDISPAELAKAGAGYDTCVADISSPDFEPPDVFDLVFSRLTAEHISDPEIFHRNVRRLLRSGGTAIHFFPTLYAFPFVVNRLLPERLSEPVLRRLIPGREREGAHGKFPALYRWCRGPTRRQIRRLEGCSFTITEYRGYFGHTYYRRLRVQHGMEKVWRLLARHPVPALTSFALVVMRAT